MAKNISNLSDAELRELDDEMFSDEVTEERQTEIDKVIAGTPEPESQPSDLVAEVEIVDEPNNPEDNSSKPQSPQGQTDNSQTQQQQPVTPQVSDELYNDIIKQHPTLAKFSKENILTELAKSYANLETKLSSRATDPPPPPTPITDEQVRARLNAEILETANNLMLRDPEIAKLLTVRDEDGNLVRLSLPQTEDEKFEMMDKYPARYQAIMERAKGIYTETKTSLEDRTRKVMEAPKINEERGLQFLKKVEDYFTKIYEAPTDDEKKRITERVETFFNSALQNKKYFVNDNGVSFLDSDIMFADFVTQNIDLAVSLSRVAVLNNHNDKLVNTADKIRKQVSMKTLGNSQASGGRQTKKFKVDLADPKSLGSIPNDVLNTLIYEAEK